MLIPHPPPTRTQVAVPVGPVDCLTAGGVCRVGRCGGARPIALGLECDNPEAVCCTYTDGGWPEVELNLSCMGIPKWTFDIQMVILKFLGMCSQYSSCFSGRARGRRRDRRADD